MSTTLSTTEMITQINRKVPFGYTDDFLMDRLNDAYRWIVQKGPFKFQLILTTLSFTANNMVKEAPTAFDEGSPATLIGPTGNVVKYLPVEDFVRQELLTPVVVQAVAPEKPIFMAWTSYRDSADMTKVMIRLSGQSPPTAGSDVSVYYHKKLDLKITKGTDVFYPTPDAFDSLIMLKAEAEIRLLYGLVFADVRIQESEKMADFLIDRYRSTKKDMAGMVEQIRKAQEIQAERASA